MTRTGAPVRVVHHTPKTGDTLRGSSVLLGGLATVIEARDEDGVFTLVNQKQRSGGEFRSLYFGWVPVGDNRVLTRVAGGSRRAGKHLTTTQRNILEALDSPVLGSATNGLPGAARTRGGRPHHRGWPAEVALPALQYQCGGVRSPGP